MFPRFRQWRENAREVLAQEDKGGEETAGSLHTKQCWARRSNPQNPHNALTV
jgi:hypothetical protein